MISLLQQALEAHKNNHLLTAEKLYLAEIASSQNPEAMQLLGSLYSTQKNFEKAERYLLASLSKNANQPHTLNNLGLCYKKQGKTRKALEFFEKAISLNPQNESSHISLVDCLITLNNLKLAEKVAHQFALKAQNSYKIYNLLGRIYYKSSQLDKAEQAFKHSLSLKPDYPVTLNNASHVYKDTFKFNKAISCLTSALQLKPNSTEILFNLGNVFAEKADFQNALKHYRHVLTLDPKHKECLKNINAIYWTLGKNKEFLSDYQNLNSEDLKNFNLHYDYLDLLINSNQLKKARQLINDNRELIQSNPKDLTLLARLEDKSGNITLSEKYWSDCCNRTNNKIPSYCFELISIYLKQEKNNLAKKVLFLALQENPSDISLLSLESLIYKITNECLSNPEGFNDSLIKESRINPKNSLFNNRELLSSLTSIHTSTTPPVDQTLINGIQTPGNLLAFSNKLKIPFFQVIEPFIRDYIQKNRNKILSIPSETSTNYKIVGAWSVFLKGGGYHTMHIHPEGNLSAVYYISLPEEMGNEQNKEGWIHFGKPNFSHPQLPTTKYVQPEIGKLIIFPSYFWHGTIPFESQTQRATIAFDIKLD